MSCYLGIDLGTTGVKAVVADDLQNIIASSYLSYAIQTPQIGFAEQDPEIWWRSTCGVIRDALSKCRSRSVQIRGVGLSGQMHGLVALGASYEVVCPAIIHCDQRAFAEKQEIIDHFRTEKLGKLVQNLPNSGFQLPSLMWLKKNNPGVYGRIRHVLLPKDYIRFRLTGEIATEVTDACSTLMFDNASGTWCDEIVSWAGIDKSVLPACTNRPYERSGNVTEEAASETGIPKGTPVAYGSGDQVAQSVGNGILRPGKASITLGTSGQVSVPVSKIVTDPELKVNLFTHAEPGVWYLLGAVMNATLAMNWFKNKVMENTDINYIDSLADSVKPGSEDLFFLPYLTGERVPLMNEKARAGFIGLTLGHDRSHMCRAIMEGVAYSLYDALVVMRRLGVDPDSFFLSGGGTRSRVWKQILADVFGCPMVSGGICEQAAFGAARYAMVACGDYRSLDEVVSAFAGDIRETVEPDMANHSLYMEKFEVFRTFSRQTSSVFSSIG
ncbi:MAG: xylulokinase [Spirochaetales bacterium]|nr:xylulokinase [Spirochaetales bacterium]